MAKMIFVNLPVKDLAVSKRFYEGIGCQNNPQFTDANAAMMVWSDTISFMLLTHGFSRPSRRRRSPTHGRPAKC